MANFVSLNGRPKYARGCGIDFHPRRVRRSHSCWMMIMLTRQATVADQGSSRPESSTAPLVPESDDLASRVEELS